VRGADGMHTLSGGLEGPLLHVDRIVDAFGESLEGIHGFVEGLTAAGITVCS
jgi:hypothetical protein